MTAFLALFIRSFVDIYGIVLIAYTLMTWFPGARYSPLGSWLEAATKPYLNLFRRLPLQIGPFDLTVYVAYISLQLVGRLLLQTLSTIG